MRKLATALALLATAALWAPAASSADFGLHDLSVDFSAKEGNPPLQAGSHPFELLVDFKVNTKVEEVEGEELEFVDGAFRDFTVKTPPGLVADPTAIPTCSTLDFLSKPEGPFELPECANSSALGTVTITVGEDGQSNEGEEEPTALYNLDPPPGAVAKFGFWALETPVTVLVGLSDEPPYRGVSSLSNAVQILEVLGSSLTIWGNPAEAVHDPIRGKCLRKPGELCPAGIPTRPFLTLPRSCTGPLQTIFRATPWWTGDHLNPTPGGPPFEATVLTSSAPGIGTSGCGKLGFAPEISTQPTTDNASSPSGLDVNLVVKDEGILSSSGTAHSDIRKAVVALPEGVTANPSVAEGLATCSEGELAKETLTSAPGAGCPQASKLGTLEVETPILPDQIFRGQVFIAAQNQNPFNSLLALYMVIKDPELGVLVKLAGKVEPDPKTGQLITTFGEAGHEIPQFPVSRFNFHFREGGRSPLISPEHCGTYTTLARFTPWADPNKTLETTSDFQITAGVGGGPCPPAGPPPFAPGFDAGSINNAAGAHTPFYMRLSRRDGDQDLVRFSAVLPKGVIARIAGTTQCPDALIAAAKLKSGKAELAAPSCPASSQIGRLQTGAGVGSQLTYVPGSLYMAGPVGDAPLSVVAIVPAVAGPFDVGTVVVRAALKVNPRTAEVRVDGALSDPIPHILAGIPLKVRDAHVHVDKPNFTLNPTGCDPSQTIAELWGGGADPFSTLDDAPILATARFQAASCQSLGFKPKLSLTLKGGTRRGDFPALRSTYKPRAGDANLKELVLRLPRSAFLEQGHFRTICTRVQFAANACPQAAIYGTARAFTPLLDTPLEGPVYLRSSDHELPDLVFDLHGLVDVEAVARVDSQKGGIRVTVEDVPDAPVSKVLVSMQGGRKGVIVNSRDLCARKSKANAEFTGQNNKQHRAKPVVKATGCKKKKK
jgi:hypothetical protein